MIDRRDWVRQVALAAGAVALPRSFASRAASPDGNRPYLRLALECARWISASEQVTGDGGLAWPADPLKPESVGLDLYNGMPGVVLFLHELARTSGEARWDEAASAGALHLEAALERTDPKDLDAGLYTGLAGLAYLFLRLEPEGRGSPQGTARRALDALLGRAREAPGGVHWNGSHDIISGNAGIGLLLLQVHRLYGDVECLEVARQAGDRLLAVATSARGGLL